MPLYLVPMLSSRFGATALIISFTKTSLIGETQPQEVL